MSSLGHFYSLDPAFFSKTKASLSQYRKTNTVRYRLGVAIEEPRGHGSVAKFPHHQ